MKPRTQDPVAAARALATQLARGVSALDPFYDEALRLLDEHEDDLDPAWGRFLDDVRFLFHEYTAARSPQDKKQIMAKIAERARAMGR